MNNKKIKTKDLTLYFDGSKSHFGVLKNDGELFINLEETFGQHLQPVQINAKFVLYGVPSAVVLKDAFENDVVSQKQIGLDKLEYSFLTRLYERGEVKFFDLLKYQAILSKKINSRLSESEATDELQKELQNLESSIEIE